MVSIVQEHFSGCAVACVAFIKNKAYKAALNDFENGSEFAKFRGFYCKEIISALALGGLDYELKYVGRKKIHDYPEGTIIHIKKSEQYPVGHYLCYSKKGWMDPWINFPNLSAKAGFRKDLPGKPVYAIVPMKNLP